MSLYINTNSEAMIAQNNLNSDRESALNSAMTDLSSGLRINTAADDAAGYAITEDLTGSGQRPQPGLQQRPGRRLAGPDRRRCPERRAADAAARPRAGGRVQRRHPEHDQDQNAIVSEVSQLASEIEQIGTQAQFNGITLFNGTGTADLPGRRQRRRDHQRPLTRQLERPPVCRPADRHRRSVRSAVGSSTV